MWIYIGTQNKANGDRMTTFVAITSGQIDSESPYDTVLASSMAYNHIAQSEGAAGSPEYSATTGASIKLLETQTASASSSIEFITDIDGTFDEYEFRITNYIPATGADGLFCKVSKDGGSTWEAGTGYRYVQKRVVDNGTEGITSSGASSLFSLMANTGTAAGQGACGTLRFYTPANTSQYKIFIGDFTTILDTTNNITRTTFSGAHISATAIDGIQFTCSTGNIEAGIFRLYGIRK